MDQGKISHLLAEEVEIFTSKTSKSKLATEKAIERLPLAVSSSVFSMSPYPVFMDRGQGAYLYDIDDNQYVDYGNGYGTSVFGHGNEKIKQAIIEQLDKGTHFGTASEKASQLSEHLCQRFNFDWVRFSPSGTEATMDALRLSRALTGRDKVAKIEGGYHGSHPQAMVSTNMELDEESGPDDAPTSRSFGKGITKSTLDEVVVLPFNDLQAAEKLLSNHDIAGLIVEPIMFNVGAIFPENGYLQGLRDICTQTGTQLIFDEVKTGVTIAYGGAEEVFSVTPDIKTLGKGIGGGLAAGAIGGCHPNGYEAIENWSFPHLGTFAGNRLVAAAGLAALTEVMVPDAYRGLNEHGKYLADGINKVIGEYQLPAYVVNIGAKGCIVWSEEKLRDYRQYQRQFDAEIAQLAWFHLVNQGIWLPAGHDEQSTHSIAHGTHEADLFIAAFRDFAAKVR